MLVLTRKTGQRTVIAGSIHVVVLSVQGNRVRLGFEGPARVPIHRAEVLERIVQEAVVGESAGHRDEGDPDLRERSNGDSAALSSADHVARMAQLAP